MAGLRSNPAGTYVTREVKRVKFVHLGDLHLGKTLGDFDLIDDQKYILDQVLDTIKKEEANAVLIAGDVYDRAVPSEAATNLLDYFLSSLSRMKVSTYMISGNHDSDDRLNYGSSLFSSNKIYISAKFDGSLHKETIVEDGKNINIYLLPFVKASQVRHFYPDTEIENYNDAVKTIIENADINDAECNILIAHQFVAGKGEDPALSGSESAGTQSVGLVEKIGVDVFDKFDYVALGHIHSPQRLVRDEVRYSGSPLKYSLSEANNNKSMPLVTVDGSKNVNIELVSLKPMRDMRHIRGEMAVLLDKDNVSDTNDFIYATLTDEDIISDAMGIIQQVYPNTVKIDYDNSHTKQIEQVDISAIAQNKSFSELISDFYSLMYGCEITDEEMEVMKMAAGEAGVVNETD